MLALNEYDALGRLKSKKVGGTDVSGGAPLQIVDYKYNIRGWLTEINDIGNLARQGNDPQNLFAFKINYNEMVADDINGAVLPLYNGNIAETFWKTSSDNILRKYGYSYDYQNRLLAAFYQKPTTTIPRADSYSTEYSYDRNGNILSLKRNGQSDMATQVLAIDDLKYTYDAGNQLQKVLDKTNHPAGFNMNGAGTNDTFVYDKYGNLTADPYKKISTILYNHLNLPTKITFLSGGKIEYFYDATGIKLKKKVTDGTTITTTEYMDGFQYTNNTLDFFPHAEGYAKAIPAVLGGGSSYQFKYVFTYTDHLGNIRLKYAQDPSNNNQISILEEDHYYPYGLKHSGYNSFHQIFTNDDEKGPGTGIVLTPVNPFLGDSYKYKFGGKEYDNSFDINTYDFGARNYDPALGRWMNIDPLAEMMRRHSPYNYAFNNPVYFIDPDGMIPIAGGQTGAIEVYDFGSGNESGALKSSGDNSVSTDEGSLMSSNSEPSGDSGNGQEESGNSGGEGSSCPTGDCPENPPSGNNGKNVDHRPKPVGDATTSSSVEIEVRKEVKTIDNKIDELSKDIKDAHRKYSILGTAEDFDRKWVDRMDGGIGSGGRGAGSGKLQQMYEIDSVNKSKERKSLKETRETLLKSPKTN
ncbi:MAG: RHS repeat-associated core domain-containing protein [Aequorivita sp.]